jgi:hypothetical protein
VEGGAAAAAGGVERHLVGGAGQQALLAAGGAAEDGLGGPAEAAPARPLGFLARALRRPILPLLGAARVLVAALAVFPVVGHRGGV